MMRNELLEVIKKYVHVDIDAININFERDSGHEILELSVALPDGNSATKSELRPAEPGRRTERGNPVRPSDPGNTSCSSNPSQHLPGRAGRQRPGEAPSCAWARSASMHRQPCSPRFGLQLERVASGEPIPGSFWGDEEAGIIGITVYARDDTPVHSLLHEAGHLIVLPEERRPDVHTDATDSIEEEDATCYLQIVLADRLPGVGRERLIADMDAWGYSFRLGSTRAWFEQDAADARAFLLERGLPC
jgi:hypothetical protein